MPTFTQDSLSKYLPVWETHLLKPYEDIKNKEVLKILDIGAGEGAATLWFAANLATNTHTKVYSVDSWWQKEAERAFDRNIGECEVSYKIIKLKGPVDVMLYDLFSSIPTPSPRKMDIIYYNGTTQCTEAIKHIIAAWGLLKEEGTMIINNTDAKYRVNLLGGQTVRYTEIVDIFLKIYTGKLEVLHYSNQLIIKKLSPGSLL